jgi:MFS family permease
VNRGARLAALSIAQVVSWGVLYYATIVAAPVIADETGWSLVEVTGLFSLGLVVSAVSGILVGRLLDNRGPRLVMTLGSTIAVGGFVLVAVSPNLAVFGIGWIVVGLAQSAVLYQAAFTVITRRYGDRRHAPMTILTLAGGLASTVFAPIVAGLLTITDWRTTFLLLAAVVAVVTIPAHWFSLERRWPPHEHADQPVIHTVSTVLRTRRFWALELSMIAIVLSVFTVTLTAIPLFVEKGMTYELAALALGLIGAGQVVGRLLFVALPRSTAPWIPVATVAGFAAVLLAALALVPGPTWVLILVGIVAGAVRGAHTLVQASAVADRWGTRNYGSINGAFAAPITIVAALTPAIGALVATGVGSYSIMALVMAGVALIAAGVARAS